MDIGFPHCIVLIYYAITQPACRWMEVCISNPILYTCTSDPTLYSCISGTIPYTCMSDLILYTCMSNLTLYICMSDPTLNTCTSDPTLYTYIFLQDIALVRTTNKGYFIHYPTNSVL